MEISLVDHHALAIEDAILTESVMQVIDHRPQDKGWLWPGCDVTIKEVGSCATLVAHNIIAKRPNILDKVLCNLLRGNC